MNIITKKHIVHTTASGNNILLTSFHYNQDADISLTVWIQAWLHGVEISGIPVIYELIEYLKKHKPHWKLVLVPIANPFSLDSQIMWLQTWYNNIHTDEQHCRNYNRLWNIAPSPFEDTMLQTLFILHADCDIILDFHCAGLSSERHVYCHTSLQEEAKLFDIPHIITRDEAWSCFEDQCFLQGKKAFTLELWASRLTSEKTIVRWLESVLSFLHAQYDEHNIWIKDTTQSHVRSVDNIKKIYAPEAGILVWHREVWEKILSGDHIASLYTNKGKEKILSPYTGIFLIQRPIHAPYKNQSLATLLVG